MKRFLMAICCLIYTAMLAFSAEAEATFTQSYTTSNNEVCNLTLTAKGDTVTIEGVSEGDRLLGISVSGAMGETKDSIKSTADGKFTATIEGVGTDSAAWIQLTFESETYMHFFVDYDNGWKFRDNGITEKNAQKVEKYTEASELAAAYYLSETADINEVKSALEEIKAISDEVTADAKSEYEKAFLLSQWVSDNIYYDVDARDESVTLETIALYNVLDKKRTVCAGFANLYAALLEAQGIKSVNLKGASANSLERYTNLMDASENHEFLAVWLESQQRWIYTDCCWDSMNSYSGGIYSSRQPTARYFDATDIAFSIDHRVDKAEHRNYFGATAYLEDNPIDSSVSSDEDGNSTDAQAVTAPYIVTDGEESEKTQFLPENIAIPILIILFIGIVIMTVYVIKKLK